MTPQKALFSVIDPALALLPKNMTSDEARVMLLAIAGQESALTNRRQLANGPARGLWQNEQGGMIRGVYENHLTHDLVRQLCQFRDCSFDPRAIWGAIEDDDFLAAGVARLGLFCDPKALPKIGDQSGAWDCYIRNWRPGKPRPQDWAANYEAATTAVKENPNGRNA